MTINELMIFVFFCMQLGIFGTKVWNILEVGKRFSWRYVIISLVFSFIAHLIIMTMLLSLQVPEVITQPTNNPNQNITYVVNLPPNQVITSSVILRLSSISLIMNGFLSIIEALLKLKDFFTGSGRIVRKVRM